MISSKMSLLVLVLAYLTAGIASKHVSFDPVCSISDHNARFDCYPEDGATESACLKRGCCWDSTKHALGISTPFCFYPTNFPSYKVVSGKTIIDSHGASYYLNKATSTFRPNEILNLGVDLFYDTEQRLRIRIYDINNSRFEVPLDVDGNRDKFHKSAAADYFVNIVDEPFAIKVFRKSNQRLIFDTSVAPLIYADQYIQFSTSLPNNYVYGIGEHQDSFQHVTNWTKYTIWTRDIGPDVGINLYGAHPFYMSIDESGDAMGFFLLNSNAMDVVLQPYPAITFMTIGGILDFFVYMGPTPNEVVRQHMLTVGLPFMPPYFSLGFHLCRWGYNTQEQLIEVIKRNRAAQIPYDVQWSDIDVMDSHLDWTHDSKNFKDLADIVADLHSNGQHYINIIDPGISDTRGYQPYDEGLLSDVFIKYGDDNKPLVGKVWPGTTVYPDFTNPNSTKWWSDQAMRFHAEIPFDGIWIDMNEPSNFVEGSVRGCSKNLLDEPPYLPNVVGGKLYSKSICPSSQQYLSNHYNLHNMYGHFEAAASFEAMQAIDSTKRPFILTRSSFAGTGKHAAHWSGDNKATWDHLYYSIPIMLNFNMFGIPMVGSDVCGFTYNTTEELCIRWMQLGSFYPFMRNHNDYGYADQDPAAFSESAQEAMRNALDLRYLLLPYAYTLHYRSHVYGETVARPLFFEFPTDFNTHSIDKQFLFGPSVLITPVLTAQTDKVDAYIPGGAWYDLLTGAQVNESRAYVTLDAPLTKINVHLRGGCIIPLQGPDVTTTASRKNPFSLIVTLNSNPSVPSYGSLFWDDGESADSIESNKYNLVNFYATRGKLQIQLDPNHMGYNTTMILYTVTIYGVDTSPSNVLVNGQSFIQFQYDPQNKAFAIYGLLIDMFALRSITIKWF